MDELVQSNHRINTVNFSPTRQECVRLYTVIRYDMARLYMLRIFSLFKPIMTRAQFFAHLHSKFAKSAIMTPNKSSRKRI